MKALPQERRDTGMIVAIFGVVVLVVGGLVFVANLAPAQEAPDGRDGVRSVPAPIATEPGATIEIDRSDAYSRGPGGTEPDPDDDPDLGDGPDA